MTGAMTQSAMAPDLGEWQLYRGVRTRRVLAFFIDCLIVFGLTVVAVPVVALIGAATFGLGWLLFFVLVPLVALTYVGWTVSGPRQATLGMRAMDVQLIRYDGHRIDAMTAVVHAVLFWAANAILTPLILLIGLFTEHKRLLHDLALGIAVIRASRARGAP